MYCGCCAYDTIRQIWEFGDDGSVVGNSYEGDYPCYTITLGERERFLIRDGEQCGFAYLIKDGEDFLSGDVGLF
ncbi:MAG: hypothetical protein EZS28_016200 [Streblomastix strix]|uniref:Uncharacterized protein n=1 Tax=Streblomastix strix TaxID=222440 RepID=A0A5J4W098_9EUKA|nr:MAG: hypothetical protein EZS28_016200 [Streblomastix strix]